ncbi:NUDIX domain-containing protein [Flammeovirga sp. SubArs3]|uniref:NUDIX hydrolase n=1 Tax=Flammeovirga sp. SubArs3 TaxID=2995316 RepID=UPI00248CE4CE|nr:NUDIX domain-containing protein [Flammeovirga sp. SubArs3]
MHFYTGKIYFEIRAIHNKHPKEHQFVIFGNASAETVWSRYKSAAENDTAGQPKYLFYTTNLEETKKQLLEKFQIRIAGGGVVFNQNDELLVIKRNSIFDIPKGHLDKGETIEECAVREVGEETGVKSTIEHLLIETFHTYLYKGKHVMKHTYWYKLKLNENDEVTLVPQQEEGIEEIHWMNIEKIKTTVWKNTYQSIKDVFLSCGVK